MTTNNHNNPLVSVIVLTYNQEHMIGQTIESILNQNTNYPFEIIIGEDASPSDNTREVCQRYVSKYPQIVRLLPKAQNKGVLKNYADCIAQARGKYMAVCAGDDWWNNPDKMQMQVEFLENNPEYGVVHTEMDMYKVAKDEICHPTGNRNPPEGAVHEALYKVGFVNAPTAVFRKDLLKYVDFDKFQQLGFKMEDYPMWLEMSRHTKFHFINQSTVCYREASVSLSHSDNLESRLRFIDATKQVQDYFYELYRPNLDMPLEYMQCRMYYMECLKYKAYRRAFKYAERTGFPKLMRIALRTYLGAWLCDKYLSGGMYRKQKGIQ